MLAEIYQVCYADRNSQYVNSVYKLFKDESERLEDQAEKAFDPSNTQGILTRRQFEAMLDRNGQSDLKDVLKKERKRSVKQQISNNIRVSFSFNHTVSRSY